MTPAPTMATSRKVTGLRVTMPAQRLPNDGRVPRRAWRPLRPGIGQRSKRLPAKPRNAGTRVRATRTAIATMPAATSPMVVRKGMPTTESPASAIITVAPAKTTALPAVPTARAADSCGVETRGEVLPVAGGDEQGVVDADGQPDHEAERRCGAGQVHDRGEGKDAGHAGAHPDERRDERESGREQGAEGHRQHEQGDQDAESLRARCLRLRLDGLSAVLDLQAGGLRGVTRLLERGLVGRGDLVGGDRVGDGRIRDAAVLARSPWSGRGRRRRRRSRPGRPRPRSSRSLTSRPGRSPTSPAGAAKTIRAAAPPAPLAGKRSCSRSAALIDSTPGIVSVVVVPLLKPAAMPPSTASSSTQESRTARRWA